MLQEHGRLRLHQILKTNEKYNGVFEKRLENLDKMKPEIPSKLIKDFNLCIKLTIECHQTAQELSVASERLIKTIPTNNKEMIERVALFQERAKQKAEVSEEMIAFMDSLIPKEQREFETQKAKEILLASLTVKWQKSEKTLRNFVDNRIKDIAPEMGSNISQDVSFLYLVYESYLLSLRSCLTIIEMGELFKGLLYMGVIDIDGGKLFKKAIDEDLKKAREEIIDAVAPLAVGAVAGAAWGAQTGATVGDAIGIGITAANISKPLLAAINKFRNVKFKSDLIGNYIIVEDFILSYQNTLLEWRTRTVPIISSINNVRSVTVQYM